MVLLCSHGWPRTHSPSLLNSPKSRLSGMHHCHRDAFLLTVGKAREGCSSPGRPHTSLSFLLSHPEKIFSESIPTCEKCQSVVKPGEPQGLGGLELGPSPPLSPHFTSGHLCLVAHPLLPCRGWVSVPPQAPVCPPPPLLPF